MFTEAQRQVEAPLEAETAVVNDKDGWFSWMHTDETPDWSRSGMLPGMEIRARHQADVDAGTAFLERNLALRVARSGRLERQLDYPALVFFAAEVVGVVAFFNSGGTTEI